MKRYCVMFRYMYICIGSNIYMFINFNGLSILWRVSILRYVNRCIDRYFIAIYKLVVNFELIDSLLMYRLNIY